MWSHRRRVIGGVFAALVVLAAGVTAAVVREQPVSSAPSPAEQRFPDVNRSALTPLQVQVLDVLRTQFDTQPPGTVFAEGSDEPWCADFVSWVTQQANVPLSNPNSGSWRIPGVYTMQEYYAAVSRLEPASYRPRFGDVVLWGPDSPMGLHANIVVAVDGPIVTTVGGNEEGGIRLHRNEIRPDSHLLGYGRLLS
jgi:hypothetical protein